MKILIVASDKGGHFAPFIEEQISALQAAGVQVVRYAIKGKGILGYLRELPALKRMIRAERPDIVHAHFGLSGLLANLQRLVPVVTTYHGSDINVPKIMRLSKIAMRLSAWNIFVSARSASLAMGYGQWAMGEDVNRQSPIAVCECNERAFEPYRRDKNRLQKRSTLLPCGINIPKPWSELQNQQVGQLTLNQWVQEKLSADVKHVLFAGAFDNAVKDPELAFAAIQACNTAMGNGQWAIESNRQSPMANRPIKLIELKGYNRDQVTALMYNCDALLMTSKTEGSPQVIKEAMACGCPIVSVDVGDVAERTSGVEGCYVVPSREPAAIAEALQQAISFKGRTNGRERIIEMGLTNEQIAEHLITIYKKVKNGEEG